VLSVRVLCVRVLSVRVLSVRVLSVRVLSVRVLCVRVLSVRVLSVRVLSVRVLSVRVLCVRVLSERVLSVRVLSVRVLSVRVLCVRTAVRGPMAPGTGRGATPQSHARLVTHDDCMTVAPATLITNVPNAQSYTLPPAARSVRASPRTGYCGMRSVNRRVAQVAIPT